MSPLQNTRYLKELRAARRAAREARRFLMAAFGKRDTLAVETRSGEAVNYVTGDVVASNGILHRRLLRIV